MSKSILLVEDEPSITEICRIVLTEEGLEVHTAADGKLARDMVQEKWYDLLLIDVRMPAMNGMEFYRWLLEASPDAEKRVAFMSGDVMTNSTQIFLETTKRPFLPKPFAPDDLKNFIAGLLKEQR